MKYPSTSAIVVRDHGIYVWGKDWQSAKTQWEHFNFKIIYLLILLKCHGLKYYIHFKGGSNLRFKWLTEFCKLNPNPKLM